MRVRVANSDGEGVNLRREPRSSSERVKGVAEGTILNADELAWRRVKRDEDWLGWVADDFLTPEAGGFRVANTAGQGVNVRREPSPASERMTGLDEGAEVLGEEHAWRFVVDDTCEKGWLAETYLVEEEPAADGEWTLRVGAVCCRENYWDPASQPGRRAAMERFNKLPVHRRRAIFDAAMDAGLDAEGVSDAAERERWKQAMRAIVLGGDGFPGECPDLNPFMLAGESGGVFRGGAERLNSSALGYFQFLAQKPIPVGERFTPAFDYGHWRSYGPFPDEYAYQTSPTGQVRQFIRAIRRSAKHTGDPMSVVREKSTPPHVWGP
jgi:hypothetical protein